MPEVLKQNSTLDSHHGSDEENRLVRRLIVFSVVLHLLIVFFHFGITSEPEVEEIAIEAAIAFDVGEEWVDQGSTDALPGAKIGKEIAVDKKILPQLPKKFELERQAEPTEKITIEDDKKKKAEQKKQKIAAQKEKQRIKKEALRKLLKENNRLSKKELALRMAKNKLKEEKKVADKTTAPMNSSLEKRLNDLAKRKKSKSSASAGTSVVRAYKGQLTRIIHSNFTLPEIYDYRETRRMAQVMLRLTSEGEIRKLKINKSSGDQAFDAQALAAVRVSAPFPPPPEHVLESGTLINLYSDSKQ